MNDLDRAVVVGIRRYPDADADATRWISNLNGPDNDALAVAEWLRSPGGGGLPKDNVRVIASRDFPDPFPHRREAGPQQRAVEDALADLADLPIVLGNQYAGRRLYVYVSGHGHAKERNQP